MSVLRWAFPSFFAVLRWFNKRFTAGGKTCVVVPAPCLLPILQSASSLTALFAAIAALMTISAILNLVHRPRLRLRISGVQAISCGDEVGVTLRLANYSRLAAYDLEF